jgi:hypothetical protein
MDEIPLLPVASVKVFPGHHRPALRYPWSQSEQLLNTGNVESYLANLKNFYRVSQYAEIN